MKFERVMLHDEQACKAWDAFVESHPHATPYHLSSWLKTIEDSYPYDPLLYCTIDENGSVQGIFPSFRICHCFSSPRVVSIPFSDYGGPLLRDDLYEGEFLNTLEQQFSSRPTCLEIRGGLHAPGKFVRYNYYKRHVIDLKSGIEAIRNHIDRKTILYSIRKAEKTGVEITQENSRLALKEFCRLNNLTRKKHGVPSQPRFFFENLFDNMVVKNHGFIVLARAESKVIAASFFLIVGKKIHYKYSASDPVCIKRYSPNHLLTWNVISWGAAHGFHELDFGRTSPDNDGLIRYKNMWGMSDVDLPYYYYPRVNGAASTREKSLLYRCFTTMWRYMPAAVSEKAGTFLFRFLG